MTFDLVQSWAGSLACVGGGFCALRILLHYFVWLGYLPASNSWLFSSVKILAVALAGGFVEGLAIETWDNLTVSLIVTFAAKILL